ncbi:MAG: YlmC/YmxH family sporulation protein [Clostridiales bacterium]|nr:YlmC/YmxH family sporulation protein [Clostridiales bacterium]
MRFSTISGKEIVNLSDGSRLGIIGDSDILIDEKTGKIKALLMPANKSVFSFFQRKLFLRFPGILSKK